MPNRIPLLQTLPPGGQSTPPGMIDLGIAPLAPDEMNAVMTWIAAQVCGYRACPIATGRATATAPANPTPATTATREMDCSVIPNAGMDLPETAPYAGKSVRLTSVMTEPTAVSPGPTGEAEVM